MQPIDNKTDRLVYTLNETCQLLGVGRDYLYQQLSEDRIGCIFVGSSRRFTKQQIKAWVAYKESESQRLMKQGTTHESK